MLQFLLLIVSLNSMGLLKFQDMTYKRNINVAFNMIFKNL